MRRKPIPAFEEDTSRESGQLQAEDASFEASLGGSKEIEWVDWLDEYRRMKEAKVRAEQEIDAVVSPKTGQSKSLPNDTKGKGKESEFNIHDFIISWTFILIILSEQSSIRIQ